MTRFFIAATGTLFFGSIGAFFLFVPPMLIATVSLATGVLLLTGLVLMFCFSTHAELQPTLVTGKNGGMPHFLPVKTRRISSEN
jgi:hypothetical protein